LRDSIWLEGCIKLKELRVPRNPACATLPLLFKAEVSNAVGSIQYRWSDGRNGTLSTADSLKFFPVRDTLIRLWARDQVGCETSVQLQVLSYKPELRFQAPSLVFCGEGMSEEWPKITSVQPPDAQFHTGREVRKEQHNCRGMN
jgi:hypothetical protein